MRIGVYDLIWIVIAIIVGLIVLNVILSKKKKNKQTQKPDLEELTKLKDLLDKGIISQEEFDIKFEEKKRQIIQR